MPAPGASTRGARRLTSPSVVRELLGTHGASPRHSMGQNFLIDANVLRIITDAARLSPSDTVIEVGPGPGALTQALLESGARVHAIESDRRLAAILTDELGDAPNLVLLEADALELDLDTLWEGPPPSRAKMVSNLPYQIAATLLVEWLRRYEWLAEYVVMVQREVAARFVAVPATKDYSSATVKIQYRAAASRVANVSRNCFYPKPRIDSAIVRLVRRETDGANALEEAFFDEVVTAAFRQRRKKLANSLAGTLPAVTRDVASEALEAIGRPASTRGEELSVAEFVTLAEALAQRARR